MVIVDKLHLHPVCDAVDQQTLTFAEGSKVLGSPELPDQNDNPQQQQPDSLESNHTAQDTTCLDITDLIYHSTYVNDISDEEEPENTPELVGTYEDIEERVDIPDSPTEPEYTVDNNDMVQPSCSLYKVPAVIVAEKLQETENREEYTTDVESYVSSDEERDVTFTDVGMGTEDAIFKPDDLNTEEEIQMVDFRPYFEIAAGEYLDKISPPYTVAPERGADYDSIDTRLARTHRLEITSPVFTTKNVSENTQTAFSLTQDILQIVNEMEDTPRIITLPINDWNVTISQVSGLQTSTSPRWGSIYSTNTRHKSRDPEAVWGAKEVRRSIKASSVIREQLKKAAVNANKYQKQIAYVVMLLFLNIGVLAVILVVLLIT